MNDDHFDAIERCELNNTFKYKLIATYFLEKVIPVVTSVALDAYCEHVGVTYNTDEEMIYRNLALKRSLEKDSRSSYWTTWKMMKFVDWLWDNDLYLVKDKPFGINIPVKPEDIVLTEAKHIMVVCANCHYRFNKAPRCPECGQLQDYGE